MLGSTNNLLEMSQDPVNYTLSMERFWVMVKGNLDGPYDPEFLIKRDGFSATTYVFQSGDEFWRPAREFAAFRQHFPPLHTSQCKRLPPIKTIVTGDMISPD